VFSQTEHTCSYHLSIEAEAQSKYYLISVRVVKKARASITKITRLMLFKKIIAIYSENHIKRINTLCGQNSE
jgi:hypothetical protein